MYSIEDLRKVNSEENIIVTLHGHLRLVERNITIDDVVRAIETGQIIEQYPKDYPFPSCLVLGQSVQQKYLHVVVSLDEDKIYLITAYFPSSDKWESDMKTRRRNQDEMH